MFMKSNIQGEQGPKRKNHKTRSVRKTKTESFDTSLMESPIFVEGKSPCRQVDLLLRARLLTLKTKDAYRGH
jgi:hypothetical protein